jgi:peptidoglycan hydrolase CwlO-like protein
MKKRISIITIILLLFSFFINVPSIEAKTLKDLRNELAQMEKRKQDSENNKQLTKKQIDATNKQINDITNKIAENENTIKKLQVEIEELTIKASEKDKEIKQIMKFLQVSNGESAYLEYIFGATDLTDFVYRLAVSEQLIEYNNKLIKEYKETVEANSKKKVQLKSEQESLANKQKDLAVELSKLGNKLNEITEVSISSLIETET